VKDVDLRFLDDESHPDKVTSVSHEESLTQGNVFKLLFMLVMESAEQGRSAMLAVVCICILSGLFGTE